MKWESLFKGGAVPKKLRTTGLKKSHEKNLDKSWIQIDYRAANKVFWQTIRRLRGKRTPVATFIEDINGVLLKHQKSILNRWREYFCELLNLVTVQHLETSEEQIDEEIHLTKTEASTAIKY